MIFVFYENFDSFFSESSFTFLKIKIKESNIPFSYEIVETVVGFPDLIQTCHYPERAIIRIDSRLTLDKCKV